MAKIPIVTATGHDRLEGVLRLIDERREQLEELDRSLRETPFALGRGIQPLNRWLETSCTLLAAAGLRQDARRLATTGYFGTRDPVLDTQPRISAYHTFLVDLAAELQRDPSILAIQLQQEPKMAVDSRKVAVVHGRNEAARRGLFAFLRALDLKPIEWESAASATGKGAPYNKQVLDALFESTQAVVILFTGDEEVTLLPSLRLTPDDAKTRRQARANVFLEAGMAFVANPDRTILVVVGEQDLPSDLHGLNYVRFDGSAESRNKLKGRLVTARCAVAESAEWLHAGAADLDTALAIRNMSAAATPPASATDMSTEWLDQEARFKRLGKHTSGVWTARAGGSSPPTATVPVTWSIVAMTGSSGDHVRTFRAEATLAGRLLVRAGLLADPRPSPEDDWLNAIKALTGSGDGALFSGADSEGRTEGRLIEDLEGRSVLACTLLAGGSRPILS